MIRKWWARHTQERAATMLVVNGRSLPVAEIRDHATAIIYRDAITDAERGLAISLVAALDELVHVSGEPVKWECWRCGATQVRNGQW